MGPKGAVRGRFKPITIIPYILKFGENPLTPPIFKFQIQSSPLGLFTGHCTLFLYFIFP
jgi:hypothetical protein